MTEPTPLTTTVPAVLVLGGTGKLLDLLVYLFGTVLDGRNAHLADGVHLALGRPGRDYYDFTWDAARAGVWDEG